MTDMTYNVFGGTLNLAQPTHHELCVCVCKTFTLADFHSHHDVRRTIHRRDSISHLTSYRGSVMEEDRRLAMFGWNLETLNMIVLPMVYNKSV